MAPFRREGVGDGCWDSRSRSSAPVSRPTASPPTSPPHPGTGVVGGARWDDQRTGCPNGRRSAAADVPARLAQRVQRRRLQHHERRRPCGRRDTKRSDWRDGRAAAITLERPGHGHGGCEEWRSGRTRAKRSRSAPASSPSGPVHAQREGSWPAISSHGRAARRWPSGPSTPPLSRSDAQRGCCHCGPGETLGRAAREPTGRYAAGSDLVLVSGVWLFQARRIQSGPRCQPMFPRDIP